MYYAAALDPKRRIRLMWVDRERRQSFWLRETFARSRDAESRLATLNCSGQIVAPEINALTERVAS